MIQDSINQLLGTAAIGAKFISGEVNASRGLQMDAAKQSIGQSKSIIDDPKSDINQKEMAQDNIDKQLDTAQKIGNSKFFPSKGLRAQANLLQGEFANNPQYSGRSAQIQQQTSNYGVGAPASPTLPMQQPMQRTTQQIETKVEQAQKYKEFVEQIAQGYSRHGKGQQLHNQTEEARELLKGGK